MSIEMLGHTQATSIDGSTNEKRLPAVGLGAAHHQLHAGVHELHRYRDYGLRPFRSASHPRDGGHTGQR